MIISLLSCAVIAFLYYYVIHLARYRRLINLIPGPPMLPILGEFLNLSQFQREELMELLMTRRKKYGYIFKGWLINTAFISISHPDDVMMIMNNTKHSRKGIVYRFFRSWFGDGLLLSDGMKWQERRKILTPTFHFNILKKFFEIMIEESDYMTKSLKNLKDSTIEDLMTFVSHHTMNIISESAMGISIRNINTFKQQQYRDAVHSMGEILSYRLIRFWYYNDIIFMISSKYRKQVKCLKTLHDLTNKIIAERKQYHESTSGQYLNFENEEDIDDETKMIGERKKRLAMLDLLILAAKNNKMNNNDIKEEVDTFMFEGHDTVATVMTYAIMLLAEYKEIQDHVRDEVDATMKKNGGKLTMAALQNLSLLERCLKETMRLYPSVFFIMRTLGEDVMLNKYLVPAGTQAHIDIFHLHRDPKFWPNPEVFDPDRFLPDNVAKRHPFAYIPFSAGSRNCIGQRFAMIEMKTLIATLVHNFYLEPIHNLKDIPFLADFILRVKHPLHVKVVPV